MGYGSEEIREMRDRLAGPEVNDGIDPKTSVGYHLYKRGQDAGGRRTEVRRGMGDEKAAQSLFTTDTPIAALESGLSGGVSGAMGGAVGSVLAKYNDGNASLLGQAEYYDRLDNYEKAVAAEKKRKQRVEEPETALSALRPADTGASRSSPEVGALLQGSPTEESAATEGREYADVDRKVDPTGLDAADEGSGQMRETYGLREPSGQTARIFFGDSVSDIFGTVLHEDYHWYNSLDQAGAKSLQDHALTYLAQMDGYESVDEMIRDKMDVYASQKLTYEQAAEELVADAWRGIFATEADFKRWVEFQRGQAEKNAGVRGSIHKVMNRVKNLLSDIISRAKEVLTIDPGNAAALKAKRLAEAQRRTLQDEYFAHAEKAMDTLRAAKENAAALKTESAAEGRSMRFSIQKDADGESYIKIDEDILNGVPQEDWKTVVKQAIKERYPNGFERNGWTILNSKDGRNEFVWSKYTKALQWENAEAYADKMRMASNLDEIIKTADEVYREPAHHKNAEAFNRGKIKVMVGPNAYEADVLTAIRADEREIFYDIVNVQPTKIEPFGGTHVESEDSRSRLPKGSIYQESADTVLKTEEGGERPNFPAKNSIAQDSAESKRTDEPVKKSVRFQLSAPVEVDQNKDLVAVHNLTEENLREALELGGLPSPSIAVVKAQEGHTKYGPISLVFNSDTIDPMVNRANRIYGSDAWTPTRPNVEYEVHADKAVKLNSELAQLSRQTAGGAFARGNVLSGTLDMEASGKSPKQLAESLSRNDAVKAAYLADKGETVQVVTKHVLMNVHDTIKPKMMSRFADVAEYEDAKVELAGRMIGDLLNVNEMNDAQAIFDSFQQWQRRAAAAAAGDETSAAKAVKDLRAVQKEQTREFNRRLAENQKAGNQSEAVQQMQEQQRRNAKAEAMLDANLDALGVDITNSGDMAEKLDVLKEAYEREWRAEKKRLKEERQQMLDEITLENKTLKAENRDLARQVANEQRRADRAEYSQIVQEREIMEWEAENQKKAEAWQQKQAQKNAIAVEVARQQRDEDIAVAEVNRLLTAGKKADDIKSKITGVVKSEYLAGNDHDREKLAQMLLRLEAGGEPLYEEKNFESWIKQDEKKQEAAAGVVDEWAEVR